MRPSLIYHWVFLAFLVSFGLRSYASEPNVDRLRSAKLKDLTKPTQMIINHWFSEIALKANRIAKPIFAQGNQVPVKSPNHTEESPDFIWVNLGSKEKVAEYAFSLAFHDSNLKTMRDIGSPRIEGVVSMLAVSMDGGNQIPEDAQNNTPTQSGQIKDPSSIKRWTDLLFYTDFANDVEGHIIKVCGHNLGADKFSHFFSDGFLFYNLKKEGHIKSEDDVRAVSDFLERTTMGLELTGVYSQADIEANVAGVKFYEGLFEKKILQVSENNKITFHGIDLCEYFSDEFSELKHPNIYSFKNKEAEKIYYQYLDARALCPKCDTKALLRELDLEKEICEPSNIGIGFFAKTILSLTKKMTVERAFSPKYEQRIYRAIPKFTDAPSAENRR